MTQWPTLKTYTGERLAKVALPVGGIGTGTVSFCGFGAWRHWEIVNRPAKGYTPIGQGRAAPFFAVHARKAGEKPVTRLLEGPLPIGDWEGEEGSPVPNAGLPRFRECSFRTAYPLAELVLRDSAMPLRATMQVFNPLVPGDSDCSGLPVALVRVNLHNPSAQRIHAAVAAALPNFIGEDGFALQLDNFRGRLYPAGAKGGVNQWRESAAVRGLFLSSEGVDRAAETWGTLALATMARHGVTHRTAWADRGWNDATLDFWDDFSTDGKLEPRTAKVDLPTASLAVSVTIPPRATKSVEFVLAWHFPNRLAWGREPGKMPATIGNLYATQFADAWAAATHAAKHWKSLERDTVAFVRSVTENDLPVEVREAALFNLSTLRSQTCFRTPDGRFFGWEGCFNRAGSCHGNCTHVWNYEHATAHLFPDLARSMREVEFSAHSMCDDGAMTFRVPLPLRSEISNPLAAADGQMGCLLKLHREWRLSGDTAWLRQLWPWARQALEFAWVPGGWDADQDGVMEGCQHNTMDVEYFGPNPQMATWYLGALRAAEQMARALGESEFATRCHDLFARGRIWVDANLFNGEYYEHHVRPVKTWAEVRAGLSVGAGAKDPTNPDFQLGAGCLIDQLAGQVNAHLENLGDLLDAKKEKSALRAVFKHNRLGDFNAHCNHMRSYVLGDESAILMASYPRGRRPERPFPYYTEVMTGFEYCFALNLVQVGATRDALTVVRGIRNRYDGRKRNPFGEAECGHHYARALASWGLIPALTGLFYSAIDGSLAFKLPRQRTTWPWAASGAWGTVEIIPGKRTQLRLTVAHGQLAVQRVVVGKSRQILFPRRKTLAAGRTYTFTLPLSS